MAEFCVKPTMMESGAGELSDVMASLEAIKEEIFSVSSNLSFEMQVIARIKSNIRSLAERVGEEAVITGLLSSALIDTAAIYKNYEQLISDHASGKVSGSDPVPKIPVVNGEELSLEKAIDVLNELSNMSTVCSAIKAVVDYIRDALGICKMDLSCKPGFFDWTGLVTSMAADILNAADNGSSQNALFADLIIDVAFFGVGVGSAAIGKAVGAAFGGLAGALAGKVIGTVVGSGAVLLMNIDFNGDEEGGSAKDAMSDWLDEQLDRMVDDREFEAVF